MILRKRSLTYRFLLLLATFADFNETVGGYFRYPHKSYCSWPKEQTNFRVVLGRLFSAGSIEKVVKEGKPFFVLTSYGTKLLKQQIPLAKFRDCSWDGRWRMLIFDIPEEKKAKRNWLRRKMKSLGFARLQKSIYISPFKIGEELGGFLEVNDLGGYAMVFEVKEVYGKKGRELADEIWNLSTINYAYERFALRWKRFLTGLFKKKIDTKARQWRDEWCDLVMSDPGLPKELLPRFWNYNKARRVLLALEKRFNQSV